MHPEDRLHLRLIGELDVVEHAPAQEGVRQFLFRVGGDDDDGPLLCLDGFFRLRDVELHSIQLPQQVVGEFQIRLVDLVDQQHHLLLGRKSLAQLAQLDIFFDVVHALTAELAVVEPLHHVIDVQAVLSLGGGLHVPDDELFAQRLRHGLCQHGLAGARLALDEQGLLQGHGDVDGLHQILRGHIMRAAAEFGIHKRSPLRIFFAGPIISDFFPGDNVSLRFDILSQCHV